MTGESNNPVMLIPKIAFRNVFRNTRRSILTGLTIFAGFTLAAVSIGWTDGSYNYIIDLFTRNRLGHIQIHKGDYLDEPTLYKTIQEFKDVGRKLEEIEELESWAPRLYASGLASVEDKSTAIQINGIDPLREEKTTNFSKKITIGSTFSNKPSKETILGKGLAKVLKAEPGDTLVIVSQGADGSIANDMYTIIGILESDNKMSDRMACYLHIQDAQQLLVLPDQCHEISIVVSSLDKVDEVTTDIRNKLDDPSLDVAPWQEFARSFYRAMQADKKGNYIMHLIIMILVAVGVLNTVLMSVLERTREYGLMKALGTKPWQIIKLVILEINIIALVSVILGIGVSIVVNYIFSKHGISLPQSFTYGGMEFTTMYSEVSAKTIYIPAIIVFLTASIAGIFPALKAARTLPAKTMRIH